MKGHDKPDPVDGSDPMKGQGVEKTVSVATAQPGKERTKWKKGTLKM